LTGGCQAGKQHSVHLVNLVHLASVVVLQSHYLHSLVLMCCAALHCGVHLCSISVCVQVGGAQGLEGSGPRVL
jgi:hypothetical protein